MKKAALICSFLLLSIIAVLAVSCGGGGGGVSAARGGNNAGKRGIIMGKGKGGTGGSGTFGIGSSSYGSDGAFFAAFPDLAVDTIDVTLVVNGTPYVFNGLTRNSSAEGMPEINFGDTVSATAVLNMQDGTTRNTSIAAQTITEDTVLTFATPYKLTYDITSPAPGAYNIIPSAGELSSVSAPDTFYSIAGCSLKEIDIQGYRVLKWVLADGVTEFVPGSTKGDVSIKPVFTVRYDSPVLPSCSTLPICSQQDYTDLLTYHSGKTFAGQTIKLETNVTSNKSIEVFEGTFDGNGKTVTLAMTGGNGGLINDNKGTIENTKFAGMVTGYTTSSYSGAACGNNNTGATVKNCSSSATVSTAGRYAGGLVGANRGTITECYTNSNVSSTADFQPMSGGICGWNYGSIEHCYSSSTVTSNGIGAGGIAGRTGVSGANTSISNCYSIASVYGSPKGGVVGGITNFGGGYTTTVVDVWSSTTPVLGGTLASLTTLSSVNDLVSSYPSIWRAGSPYPTLINTP